MSALLLELPKKCTRCGEMKPLAEFHFLRRRNSASSWCRQCKSSDGKTRYAANIETARPKQREAGKKYYWRNKEKRRLLAKKRRVKYLYGVSYETASAMLAMQNDACGICQKSLTVDAGAQKREWNVDHCHDTGKIRGILCSNCNTALGLMKENQKTLAGAIRYLKAHEVKS